jgi:putative cell wall-binding protein
VVIAGGAPLTAEAALAAPLARHLRARLLLVARDSVPASVAAWLKKRQVKKVIVVGGADTVADATVASLAQLTGSAATVSRIAGADRYATGALVARQIGAAAGFAVVAPGDDAHLQVAVAAAGAAAAGNRPLLLVPPEGVPATVAQALVDLKVQGTTCAGGTDAISETTRTALPACSRVTGADGAATAAALVTAFERTARPSTLAVATAVPTRLTDALAGAGRGMLVVYSGAPVPPSTLAVLRATPAVRSVTVFGGASAVPAAAVTALRFA